jgi:hypothetical protein
MTNEAEKQENIGLLKRLDSLGPFWAAAEEVFDDIERYIMPLGSGGRNSQSGQGKKWTTREIWDSTAPIGANRLASVFYSNLISSAFQWFGVEFDSDEANLQPKWKEWIQACSQAMFNAINGSNFPVEMSAAFQEYVGPGAFCLTQQPASQKKWDGFEFGARSIRNIRFEEDHRGRVGFFGEDLKWTPAKIISKFGGDDLKKKNIPEIVLKRSEANDQTEMPVAMVIYRRPDKKPYSMTEKARAAEERPFGIKYILREGAETLGPPDGLYEMSVYIGRYHRAAGSPLGFGPSHLALPTVKLLNGLQESIVLAAEKVVDPATLVTERGLLSDLDLGKGGLTTVRTLEDIGPYESSARFDVSQDLLARQQMMVRKHYREDDISLKESPAMTASEASLRVDQMNRLFGPQVGPLGSDVFSPMLQTTFNTMWRENQLPEPPKDLLEAAPGLKIIYHGPMMRSLRQDDVIAIERLSAGVAALAKMNLPEAADVFKADEAVRQMADRLGVPGSLLRTAEEVEALRQQRMALQQAAAKAEIAKTASEADRAAAGASEMMNGGGR